MDLQLEGKRALVFGGSKGIGRAIAHSLAREGAKVIICARGESELRATAQKISAEDFLIADTTGVGESQRAVDFAARRPGGLDILVHNTGGPPKAPFLEVSLEQWQLDYQSLWLSLVESLHHCLPPMAQRGFGRVIVVSSIAAREPLPLMVTSNALRSGLNGLIKTVANEVAPQGITINAMLPGYTNTQRLQALNLDEDQIKHLVPTGHLCQPEELGDLAAFLASPRANSLTGQSIAVDGGVLQGH